MKRNIKDTGIVLKRIPYQETSLIAQVFCAELGHISLIAKGVRKAKSGLVGVVEPLNKISMELYKSPQSEMYTLGTASLESSPAIIASSNARLCMLAAVEVYQQILFDMDSQHYMLLDSFMEYIREVKTRHICIFWRFLLRLFDNLGIPFTVHKCSTCQSKNPAYYHGPAGGLLCKDCHQKHEVSGQRMSVQVLDILKYLPNIGNYLNDIEIDIASFHAINNLFKKHFEYNFGKELRFKAMEMYQFYEL